MTLEQIQQQQSSPAFINFIESLSPSKATRRSYEQQLKKFMSFLKVNDPQELLKWDSKVIESRITDFIIRCRKEGRAQQSIHCYYMAIKHFFEINDVVLNWKKLKLFVGRANGKKAIDRPYTHAEIHSLINRAEPRMKIAILLMCSAGLRLGALPYLSVGNLRKIFLPSFQKHIYEITVYAGEPESYKTYCTFECADVIDSYLQFRQKNYNEIIDEQSPLLINLPPASGFSYDNDDEDDDVLPIAMKQDNIKALLWMLMYNAGIRQKENKKSRRGGQRHIVMGNHGARKFFKTQCTSAGVGHQFSEDWLGHSTGLHGVYNKPLEHEHLEQYTKAIPYLTINEEERQKRKVAELTAAREKDQSTFQKKYEEMSQRMEHYEQQFEMLNKRLLGTK